MIKFSDLSKEAQRRVRANKFCVAYARQRGKAGWSLRFVNKGDEKAMAPVFEAQGYRRIKLEK